MTTEEMIKFASEQLEIFAENSDMGKFLQSVIEELTRDKWISVEDRLPEKDGEYLCVYKSTLSKCNCYEILEFTTDAFNVDKYDFSRYKNKKKSLFYSYESEYGYYEWDKVIAWQPIPEYHFAEADKKIGGAE